MGLSLHHHRSQREAVWTPASLGSSLKGWWRADSGVRGRTAAQFTAANSESLSVASNAGLATGDVDFWWAGWAYHDGAVSQDVAGKWGGSTNEWLVLWVSTGAPQIFVGGSNKTSTDLVAAGNWAFIMAYHDKTNDLIGISVNGGAFQTTALVGGPTAGNSAYGIGARQGGSPAYFGGRIANSAFGKSPSDSFATINALLYNSGNGLRYADLTAAQITSMGLISWHELDEESGTRADKAAAGNTLTDNNTVTANDGKVAYIPVDGQTVWKWTDQSATGLLPVQATHTLKPLLKTSVINGRNVIRLDGVDDYLKVATGAISNQPLWGWIVIDDNDAGTRFYFDGGAASKVSLSHTANLILNAGSALSVADTSGAPHLITFIANGASSFTYVDGTQVATGAAGAQNMDSGITIGADNAGASPLQGDIAELAFVAGSPSVADLANLKTYISARYGLTVS